MSRRSHPPGDAKGAAQQAAWENRNTLRAMRRVTDAFPGTVVQSGPRMRIGLSEEDSHLCEIRTNRVNQTTMELAVLYHPYRREMGLRRDNPDIDWDDYIESGRMKETHREHIDVGFYDPREGLPEALIERIEAFDPDFAERRVLPAPWEVNEVQTEAEVRELVEERAEEASSR